MYQQTTKNTEHSIWYEHITWYYIYQQTTKITEHMCQLSVYMRQIKWYSIPIIAVNKVFWNKILLFIL